MGRGAWGGAQWRRFDKVGVTLRVTKAAKSGRWLSSLGE